MNFCLQIEKLQAQTLFTPTTSLIVPKISSTRPMRALLSRKIGPLKYGICVCQHLSGFVPDYALDGTFLFVKLRTSSPSHSCINSPISTITVEVSTMSLTQKVVPSTVSGVVSAIKPRPRPLLPRPKPRPADLFPALRPRPAGARIIRLNNSNVRGCVVTHRKSQPPHRLLGKTIPASETK